MKQLVFLLAIFCLLTIGAFAQVKTTDYSGEWSLDKGKSTLSDRMKNIESMTMIVAQTDKELTVTSSVKRAAPPAGAPAGPPPGSGQGGGRGTGGGMGMMGDRTMTYSLDGKETSTEAPGPGGSTATTKSTAKIDGGKLNLSTSRSSQRGESKSTEIWEIQADGSLKIKRTTDSPFGSESNELVFTKKTK
jgi:hypothetical protein